MSRSRCKWANAKKGRAASYSQPFVGHLVGMLELPAYRVLTLSARRVLDRLEIELLRHGGNENGRLAVTYLQFEDWGVRGNSVAAAVREVIALGFAEITERGCAGNAGHGKPNLYRLTYRPAEGHPDDGSHEWKHLAKTVQDALRIQKEAHQPPRANVIGRGGNRVRKTKPQYPIRGATSPPTSQPDHPPHRGANSPNSHPPHRGASSISRSGPSAAGRQSAMTASKPQAAAPAQPSPATASNQPDEGEQQPWSQPAP